MDIMTNLLFVVACPKYYCSTLKLVEHKKQRVVISNIPYYTKYVTYIINDNLNSMSLIIH